VFEVEGPEADDLPQPHPLGDLRGVTGRQAGRQAQAGGKVLSVRLAAVSSCRHNRWAFEAQQGQASSPLSRAVVGVATHVSQSCGAGGSGGDLGSIVQPSLLLRVAGAIVCLQPTQKGRVLGGHVPLLPSQAALQVITQACSTTVCHIV
jgi:hypothetical protein